MAKNSKMYSNVLKIHFLNENPLENVSIALKLEMLIVWNGLTLNFKLNPGLKVDFSNFFFFSMPSLNLKEFSILDHFYLAYLKSYGHLKIKMYSKKNSLFKWLIM